MLSKFELELLEGSTDDKIIKDLIKTLDEHLDDFQTNLAEMQQALNELDDRLDNI